MKIAIVGAGAIGGLLGVRLARAGETVTLVDVGEQRRALLERGLTLVTRDGDHLDASDAIVRDLDEAGPQDLIVLGVKAHDLSAVAPHLPDLYTDSTVVLPVQNGLPWWYFQRQNGARGGQRLLSLDPDGTLERCIPAERLLGSVVYPAAENLEPGVIRHVEGNRIVIGELDDLRSERADIVIDLLARAGFKSFFLEDLRGEIWLKLLGSAVFNPLSALTGATMGDICRFPPSRELAIDVMREVEAVAGALGIAIRLPIEQRMAGAERVGSHKTSALQDVEAGRRLEVAALVGAVLEIAASMNVPVPHLRTLGAAFALLDRKLGDQPAQRTG